MVIIINLLHNSEREENKQYELRSFINFDIMISSIHYIYIYIIEFVSVRTKQGRLGPGRD